MSIFDWFLDFDFFSAVRYGCSGVRDTDVGDLAARQTSVDFLDLRVDRKPLRLTLILFAQNLLLTLWALYVCDVSCLIGGYRTRRRDY